jgi:hypothetical protein
MHLTETLAQPIMPKLLAASCKLFDNPRTEVAGILGLATQLHLKSPCGNPLTH